MQIQSLCAVAAALWALLQVPVVSANSSTSMDNSFAPVYIFNNNTVEVGKMCPPDEWLRVQTAMGAALESSGSTRRHRRTRIRSTAHRRTALKCSSCGGRPLCLATIGIGCARLYSRRRLLQREQNEQDRQLNDVLSPCSNKIAAVDAALTSLTTSLSPSCRALVTAPRHVQCAEYTHDCDILGFTVIRPTTAQTEVIKLNSTGTTTSFCSSVGSVTIRADANFDLGGVTFSFRTKPLQGAAPPTHWLADVYYPYVVFGKAYPRPVNTTGTSSYQVAPTFYGRVLQPGNYTVLAFSQSNPLSNQTAKFIVKNC